MVPIRGAYANQDYLRYTYSIREDPPECEGKENQPSLTPRCVFSRGRGGDGVWQCPCQCWKGQSKADMCVNWAVCVRACARVCGVYAVTLPLIQLSKLLSDARDWQGFHSTVLDTQTHNSLSVLACAHKSKFFMLHSRSLTFTSLVPPALWTISRRLQALK